MAYSNEELLEIIRKYNNEVGFSTQRDFKPSNGLPNYRNGIKLITFNFGELWRTNTSNRIYKKLLSKM